MTQHSPVATPLRRLTTALAVLGILTALAACSSQASPTTGGREQAEIRVGAPWSGTAGKTPVATGAFGYAVARGLADPILAEHGLSYGEFVGFNNGPPVIQALQSGDIDVAVLGDTPATQAKGSGIDIPLVIAGRPSSDIWFLTRTGGVETIEQLAGGRVGLQFGSNFDKYGRAVLERRGVLDQVELVNLLFADALPALQRGEIDAVPLPATTAGIWRADNDFPILSKASEDDPDLLATSVTVANPDALQEHPELADVLWEITAAGNEEILDDTDAYATWLEEATGTPAEVTTEAELWQYGTEPLDPEGMATIRTTLDFLIGVGTVPEPFDVDAWPYRGEG